MNAPVKLITMPHFDPGQSRVAATMPFGMSIAEFVDSALPGLPEPMRQAARVTIGDNVILPEIWHRVRPKPGVVVLIRVVPGKSNILRSVLLIAASVAAVALGQLYLTPLLAGPAIGLSAGVATAVTGAVVSAFTIGATLAINALVPLRKDRKTSSSESPSYSIQGWRNTANPDGVVPAVMGKIRYAPTYAALPYGEAVGDYMFATAAFCVGYGPVRIKNLRIGDTPIERFAGVTYEVREGYPDDEPLTIYPQQVLEEPLSIELRLGSPVDTGGAPVSRFTAADATEASVDISFPSGIIAYTDKGAVLPYAAGFIIEQRPVGGTTWAAVLSPTFTDARARAKVNTVRWMLPSRGRWEVRVYRITPDDEAFDGNYNVKATSRSYWSAIRSYRPEYPLAFPKPLALIAARVLASGQLSGTLDELNADISTVCPDWNATSGAWEIALDDDDEPAGTNNPAALFRHVLLGPAIRFPITADETYALEDWWTWCRDKGFTYNRVHDYEASVYEVLSDIAAAGRATPHDSGTAWGVVVDRILDTVIAHISPRNSFGFSGERSFTEMADAFRVSFLDETNHFQRAERIVPRPDLVGDPRTFEKIDLPGITDPDLIWREARRRWYELYNRPDTYTVNQDFESLVVSRGDLVMLSHDVLDGVQVSARVLHVDPDSSVIDTEGHITGSAGTSVALDENVIMQAGHFYAVRFRFADGTTLLRSVATQIGETRNLVLIGSGRKPEPDDLAMFGIANRETFECIVKGTESADNLGSRITLIDHAPQIETLADSETPPPWTGRAGGESDAWIGTPVAPVIDNVVSGREASQLATLAIPYPIAVTVEPGEGNPVPLSSYTVQHRLSGATSWNEVVALASTRVAIFGGYAKNDMIEVRAHATSIRGTVGPDSAISTHTVADGDPDAPTAPSNLQASYSAGRVTLTWTQSSSSDAIAAQLYRATGAGAFFGSAVAIGGPISGGPNSFMAYYDDGLSAATYRYWVLALDDLSPPIASTPAGPVNVTVT